MAEVDERFVLPLLSSKYARAVFIAGRRNQSLARRVYPGEIITRRTNPFSFLF